MVPFEGFHKNLEKKIIKKNFFSIEKICLLAFWNIWKSILLSDFANKLGFEIELVMVGELFPNTGIVLLMVLSSKQAKLRSEAVEAGNRPLKKMKKKIILFSKILILAGIEPAIPCVGT